MENKADKNVEEVVINLWKKMFDTENINPDSDFFDIGGNSLTAMKFLHHIDEIYGEDILPVDDFFETGTVKEIVSIIEKNLSHKK